ncbi:MAG: thiamine phosphate synthase [Odoribacter sp.]|nr:thiamine phosphate synthase [Odoribacter sp.]
MVQLREKDASTIEFYNLAIEVKKCLAPYNVPLIINDRIDIALACDTEGLHIGQRDMPYSIARKLMGKNKIIGISVENKEQAEEANKWDVDYIGISPVFGTPTKTDTAPPLGIEGVKLISSISNHPSVVIGGIKLENIGSILQAGATGVAVVSAIMSAENIGESVQKLKEEVIRNKEFYK